MLLYVWVGRNNQQVEVSHLFFANDTMIICQLVEEMVLNLRAVLLYFQAVQGLDINLDKSEMVSLGGGVMRKLLLTCWGAEQLNFL